MESQVISQAEVESMIEKLTGMFDHIRNTFVNASQLAQTVQELQEKVNKLQVDFEQAHLQNVALNETISSLTEQRNAVVAERDHWRNEHNALSGIHSQLQNEHSALRQRHDDLEYEIVEAKHQRDDALMEVRRLSDENALLQERLKRTQRYIDNMKATLAGEQTRDDNGHFEELPKVASSW